MARTTTKLTALMALAAFAALAATPARADLFGAPNSPYATVALQSQKAAAKRVAKPKSEDAPEAAAAEPAPSAVSLGPLPIMIPHLGLAVAP